MIYNKNKPQALARCDVMALITMTLIACNILAMISTTSVCMTSYRSEIRAVMSTIEMSLAMYEADLGALPPDHKSVNHTPRTADECTPNNRAPKRGIFDNSLSKYYDDNLVRHLDGDTSNDKDIPGYDDVSARPLDNYLDINEEDLRNKAGNPVNEGEVPIITTRFGSTIKYNELASERRTQKFQVDNPDPRMSIVKFDSFQIYCEYDDLEKYYPRYFKTNFRNDMEKSVYEERRVYIGKFILLIVIVISALITLQLLRQMKFRYLVVISVFFLALIVWFLLSRL